MITLTMDKREKYGRRSRVRDTVSLAKDISIDETNLPICDYVVSRDGAVLFGVEWKTYDDYVNSIMSNHLKSQLDDMDKCEFPCYLILTGNFVLWLKKMKKLGGTHITKEQINGFTTSVAGRHKTKLIHVDNEDEGVDVLLKLISIHKGDKSEVFKLPERRKFTGDPHLDMFLAVPGVGPKTAKELSDKWHFCNCLELMWLAGDRDEFKKKYGVTVKESVFNYLVELYR